MNSAFGETTLIEFDQSDLTNGGGGLFFADGFARILPAELVCTDSDRSGRHDHHFASVLDEPGNVSRERREFVGAKASVARQGARADLDDDSPRFRNELPGLMTRH